jgi:hypothetical protein
MGILYKVPRIGAEPTFKQKGPTCWYYAAKMLLKFHNLYDKSDDAYNEFKALHELWSVLTRYDFDTRKESVEAFKAQIKKCNAYTMLKKRQDSLTPNQKKSLQDIEEWVKGNDIDAKRERIEGAIKTLKEMASGDLPRLELLMSFVPNAGFASIPVDQYQTDDQIEDLLERRGPFYSGGHVVAAKGSLEPRGDLGGDHLVYVKGFEEKGSHAIIVIGANGNDVYYKDPNGSDQIRMIDRKKFFAGIDREASDAMIGIWCKEMNIDEGRCIHQLANRVNV